MKKFNIGGKKRGLCFGTLCYKHYCEKMGGDIEQLDKIFTTADLEQVNAVSTLIWAAMVAHVELYGDDFDFSLAHVIQWVGDMDGKDFELIMEEFKKSRYMGRSIADYYYTPVEQEAADKGKKATRKKL